MKPTEEQPPDIYFEMTFPVKPNPVSTPQSAEQVAFNITEEITHGQSYTVFSLARRNQIRVRIEQWIERFFLKRSNILIGALQQIVDLPGVRQDEAGVIARQALDKVFFNSKKESKNDE